MKQTIFFLWFCIFYQGVTAQKKCSECFSSLKNGITKLEIASFWPIIDAAKDGQKEVKRIAIHSCSDSNIVFIMDSLRVEIKAEEFDTNQHKLTYGLSGTYKFLHLIDSKRFFGTDGDVPKKKIKDVRVVIDERSIYIPGNAFNDLYEPAFNTHSHVYYSYDGKRIYIAMLNSDGAGAYYVTWIFEDGKYKERLIEYEW